MIEDWSVTAEREALAKMHELAEWSARDIYVPAGAAVGEPPHGKAYRLVDRLIQKHRKAGNIEQVRHAVWTWIGDRP